MFEAGKSAREESHTAAAARRRGFEPTRTLRDEFAMAALAGILAEPGGRGEAHAWASAAYLLADAMLAARAPTES